MFKHDQSEESIQWQKQYPGVRLFMLKGPSAADFEALDCHQSEEHKKGEKDVRLTGLLGSFGPKGRYRYRYG